MKLSQIILKKHTWKNNEASPKHIKGDGDNTHVLFSYIFNDLMRKREFGFILYIIMIVCLIFSFMHASQHDE
jgi:hypothetical protein